MPRLTISSETEVRHIFGLASILGLLVIYMVLARRNVELPPRAEAPDETAAVDTSSRPVVWGGVLDAAVDRLPLESLDDTAPWKEILWHLRDLTVAEVTTRAEAIAARDLVHSPERYRGRFVRAAGVLIEPLAMRRIPKNGAGYETAWRGVLVDSDDTQHAFAFDIFEKPSADFVARKEPVQLEGIFCQVVTYSARGGEKPIAYIAGKSLGPLEGQKVSALTESPNILITVAICLAILPFLGFAFSAFSRKKDDRSLVAAVERARSRPKLARRADAPAGPSQEAPPPPGASAPPPGPSPPQSP